MTDLTPNHPAVEAAARSAYERAWCGENEPWSEVDDLERDEWRADEAHSLTAALPHLTADDLRNTPAGRALMAEGRDARPPEPLPCGCENPLNAVHLLDH